jgi:glutamate 5-kinase
MRHLEHCRRITVKIGTNLLSGTGGISRPFLERTALQIAELNRAGREVLLVSSGAIGMGAGELGIAERVSSIPMRQACASIGQPLLMQSYREIFRKLGITVSQILLTRETLNNRLSYVNLQNSINALLELKVIPIFNENDSVSTAEIGTAFGDNDTLSALIASKTDSDLLVILTDIDGLYTKDPARFAEAVRIPYVGEITDEIRGSAGSGRGGSTFSTGGMKTKLKAAQIASSAGCPCVIADGYTDNILLRLLSGEELGTYFEAREKIPQRVRWILQTPPAGTIRIDAGAEAAIRSKKSLLPIGVTAVEGVFEKNTVVAINDIAKAVTSLTSEEIRSRIGCRSRDIEEATGRKNKLLIARPDDIVFLS